MIHDTPVRLLYVPVQDQLYNIFSYHCPECLTGPLTDSEHDSERPPFLFPVPSLAKIVSGQLPELKDCECNL
jgi:hypothetical protein